MELLHPLCAEVCSAKTMHRLYATQLCMMTQHPGLSCTQARTPTPPRRESTPLAVVHVRQQAELAEAEVAAVWAGQLASALEMNQDLEETILTLRQQNTNLKRCLFLPSHM